MKSTITAMWIRQCNAQPNSPNAPFLFAKVVNDSLVRQGMEARTAAAWSTVYASAYTHVHSHPSLWNPFTLARIHQTFGFVAQPLGQTGTTAVGYEVDALAIFDAAKTVDASLGIAGLSGLIDLMVAVAKAHGVTLNGCLVSIAKVSTDLASMAIGGATSLSGLGLVLFLIGTAGVLIDTSSFASTCGPS